MNYHFLPFFLPFFAGFGALLGLIYIVKPKWIAWLSGFWWKGRDSRTDGTVKIGIIQNAKNSAISI